MTLNKEQEDEVRKQVVAQFGEEVVKKMDLIYMEFNDLRLASTSSFDFLDKVKNKYPGDSTEIILAGLLFGMKMGEVAIQAQMMLEQQAKGEKEKLDREDDLRKKELAAEWEAADRERKAFAEERDYQ